MHNAFNGVSPAPIEWRESQSETQPKQLAPYSPTFDDVYFNSLDGIAESQYVFLEGNKLHERFKTCNEFTVFETGFGSGLNFFLTAKLWQDSQQNNNEAILNYYSIEQYPLKKQDLIKLHSKLSEKNSDGTSISKEHLESLIEQYPPILPGIYSIKITEKINLHLIYYPLSQGLKEIAINDSFKVDAWFLDGFAPSKNPEMWSKSLWHFMALYAHSKSTSFATFTAASHVRKTLENYGFIPEKRKGFGRKREMLVGTFNKKNLSTPKKNFSHDYLTNRVKPCNIAIIGAGLAGASLAFCFNQYNKQTSHGKLNYSIFEKSDSVASAASSMPALLATPNLSRDHNYFSQLTFHGFYQLQNFLKQNPDLVDADKAWQLISEKYSKYLLQQLQSSYQERLGDDFFSTQEILSETGILMPGLQVNGPLLCNAFLEETEKESLYFNHEIQNFSELEDFDHIVICTGYSSLIKTLNNGEKFPSVMPLRGQLTAVNTNKKSLKSFDYPVNYDHHLFKYQQDFILGATFDNSDDLISKKSDDNYNIEMANQRFNFNLTPAHIKDNWTGIRASTYDRFPFVGLLKETNKQSIWLNYGYGTRGLSLSLLGAQIISSALTNQTAPVSKSLLQKLSPKRVS